MEPTDHSTRRGTLGGTLLVLIVQLNPEELLKTAVLAAIGASVSFVVTVGWKQLAQWVKRKRGV